LKNLIISCSLRPGSNSRKMAVELHNQLKNKNVESELMDLRDYDIPVCDGDKCYDHETTIMLRKKVEEAKCVVISTPVYNFNVSSTAKNFVELTGRMWEGKIAGFMSAAGGRSGYMSVMSLANSLMLDFRVVIIPKHVHAERSSFKDEKIEKEIEERIEDLAKDVIKFSNAL